MEFSFFVINPYSQKKEEAIEFIKSYIDHWNNSMNLLLLKSKAHPMEEAGYASRKESALLKLAE